MFLCLLLTGEERGCPYQGVPSLAGSPVLSTRCAVPSRGVVLSLAGVPSLARGSVERGSVKRGFCE